MQLIRTLAWIIFILLSVFVGLYPFTYFIFDMSGGFPSLKSSDLLQSLLWRSGFYLHIVLGGIAMLAGFSQFSKKLRNWNIKLHRTLGKIYLVSVGISGVSALYIAMFATGGLISTLGFIGLAILWIFTSLEAYIAIRNGDVDKHQHWVIRSYALCCAAISLRIWAPLFQFGFGMEFVFAYRIISWLAWVPNLVVAEIIIQTVKKKKTIRTYENNKTGTGILESERL